MSSQVVIPPGKTFIDTLNKSFADVKIEQPDQGIDTTDFLAAADSLTTLFGNSYTMLQQSGQG